MHVSEHGTLLLIALRMEVGAADGAMMGTARRKFYDGGCGSFRLRSPADVLSQTSC